MNEQSFLIDSKLNQDLNSVKDKHHDSPVRRSKSPVMKSFFKIKQSTGAEIMPSRV